jgi:membrane protein YqaA with SNARE-associated domain
MMRPGDERTGTADTRIERWARHPAGPVVLGLFAVLEACLFPAPTEAMLAALSLARPRRTWRFAAIAVGASLLGALIGYAIGHLAHGSVGWGAAETVGAGRIEALGERYRAGAFWVLATSGFTPIPYLAYTIAGGVYGVPLLPFVAGALVGRGLKYFLLGFIVRALSPYLRRALARPGWLAGTLLLVLVLAIAYVVLR